MPIKHHEFAINPGNPDNTFVLPFVFIDKVKEAVESIWKCYDPAQHRLILIDNSSEDFEDRPWLESHSHLYIRSYRNLGPAVSYNLGILLARTEYITIFSDDARLVDQSWFEEAITIIRDEEKRQVNIESYTPLIISANSVYPQNILSEEWYGRYHRAPYDYLNRKFGGKRKGFGLACAVGKKESWLQAGLFDEASYIYSIDGIFAAQAEKNGVNCFYNGVVFHYGDSSHKGRLVEEGKYQQTGVMADGRMNL